MVEPVSMIDWHAISTPADGIVLSVPGTVFVCALLAWIAIGQPLLSRALHRRFLVALGAGQPDARVRFYRLGSAKLWLLAAIVLLLATPRRAWAWRDWDCAGRRCQ